MKKIFIILIFAFQFFPFKSVYAMDALYALTHGKQYSLALGEVTKIDAGSTKINIKNIISGESLPDVISVKIPGDYLPTYEPTIEPNDYVIFSLNKEVNEYVVALGYFRVTGLDIKTLEILEGPLPQGDLAALQWYINSGGVENDFYFMGINAYVKHSDGSSTMIYPMSKTISSPTQTPTQSKVVDITKTPERNLLTPETVQQNQSSYRFLRVSIAGIFVVVFVVALIFFRKKAG